MRRREATVPTDPFVWGDLIVDYAQRKVNLAGQPVQFVALEYRLLAELTANGGRVLTYDQLLERVWGAEIGGDVRPTRTAVSKLRAQLGDDADNPKFIFTEPRLGYRVPKCEKRG